MYDVTDEASFNNIRNWMRNIEQHASDTVNKACTHACTARMSCSCCCAFCCSHHRIYIFYWFQILIKHKYTCTPPLFPFIRPEKVLVGNKSDMADEQRAVPYARGAALAAEYGIPFFETSAKDTTNVEEVRVFFLVSEGVCSSGCRKVWCVCVCLC